LYKYCVLNLIAADILFVGVILSLSKDFLLISGCFDKLNMTSVNGSANKKIAAESRAVNYYGMIALLF